MNEVPTELTELTHWTYIFQPSHIYIEHMDTWLIPWDNDQQNNLLLMHKSLQMKDKQEERYIM